MQRDEAQTDLSAIRPFVFGKTREIGTGYQTYVARRVGRDFANGRGRLATCSNGSTYSQTGTATGIAFVENFYYDAACASLWQAITGTQPTPTTSNGTTIVNTQGVDTVYSASGALIEVDNATAVYTLTTSPDTGSVSYSATSGPDANTARDTFGLSCFSGTGAMNCIAGDLQKLVTMDTFPAVGATVSDAKSLPDVPNDMGFATFSEGAPSAMSLVDTYRYMILGSSFSQDVGEVRTETNDGTSIQTSDTVQNMNGTVTQTARAVTGSVSQATTNRLLASYSLDINGFGSIQYSDGSMGTVTAFAIQR